MKKKSIYEYTAGDQSSLILLYGVATIYITLMFIVVWREAVKKSSYKSEVLAKSGKHLNTFLKKTSRVCLIKIYINYYLRADHGSIDLRSFH